MTFLIDNHRKIITLDLNPYQNYLLDLKMATFRSLDYSQLLEFFGLSPSRRRAALYQALRSHLTLDSCEYWDNQPEKIHTGVIHCGRYEGYMHFLQKWFNRLMGRSLGEKLFAVESDAERYALYRCEWDNRRWRFLTRVLLSRTVMALLFDKVFFTQLEESFSFGNHFRDRLRRAVVELPLHKNYFFSYIMLGRFSSYHPLPVYLRRENFDAIPSPQNGMR